MNWKQTIIAKIDSLLGKMVLFIGVLSDKLNSLDTNKVETSVRVNTTDDLTGGGSLESNLEIGLSSATKEQLNKNIESVQTQSNGDTIITLKDGTYFTVEPTIIAPIRGEDFFNI